MANIMSMKSVKNKVHKNGFDLSSRIGFTAKVGEILPIQWKMVYPGETFKFHQGNFTRTTPVNTAAYSRIRESYDTFFVPIRLLWDKFPQWISQTKQSQYAGGPLFAAINTGTQPYMTDADIVQYLKNLLNNNFPHNYDSNNISSFQQCWKLLDCLGYIGAIRDCFNVDDSGNVTPTQIVTPTTPTALNIFPLLAYQKIYSDFFRYQQWEDSKPYTFNLDYVLTNYAIHLPISDYTNVDITSYSGTPFELHYRNYPKDYFTGQLPNSQFGDVALAGPLQGAISLSTYEGTSPASNQALYRGTNGQLVTGDQQKHYVAASLGSSFANGISVLAIRQAQALQKWKEITQASGFDYKSQMKAHWNVNVGNVQSDKCFRVGGFDSNINITEVVNQALTPDSPANIAGKGISGSGSSFTFKNTTNEYGILMTVYSSSPVLDYASDCFVSRELLKVSPTDYAIPEFDSIGMQETYACEILSRVKTNGNKLNLNTVGYAPRYAEYKTERDIVRGGFLFGYDDWVTPISRAFLNNVTGSALSYLSFKINPVLLNSIFLAQVKQIDGITEFVPNVSFDDDQLVVNFMNSCHAVRGFSRNGLPY